MKMRLICLSILCLFSALSFAQFPVKTGAISDMRVQEETGDVQIETSPFFIGNGLSFELKTPLSGLSINSQTGLLTINSNTVERRLNTIVTVTAKNTQGTVDQSFKLTVGPQLGVAISFNYLRYKSDTQLTAIFDDMYNKNVIWLRTDLYWADIEKTKGTYLWNGGGQSGNNFERIARLAEASGLKVIWLLQSSPSWAKLSGVNGAGPADATAFAKFASEAVKHFTTDGFNVRHWEIWNEPNLPSFWDTGYMKHPPHYNSTAVYLAEMHVEAYDAIKAIDPTATVISAGLSSVPVTKNEWGKVYINPTEWLLGMYAVAGFSDKVDAIGIHPYVHPNAVLGTESENGIRMMRQDMRNFLVEKGHGDKKVWITEFGAPTAGTVWNKVTEEKQRDYLRDLYDFEATTSWGGPLIWYTWFDLGASGSGGADESENWFGAHGTADKGYPEKPVVEIFRTIKRGDDSGWASLQEEIESPVSFSISPNPAKDIVHIKSENNFESSVRLYSLQGALLLETLDQYIDVSVYPNGTYLLEMNGITQRLIINH